MTLALDDVLTRQVASLDEEIRQVDAALRLDATERAAQLRAIDDRRATGLSVLSAGEALLERLRPDGAPPAPAARRLPGQAGGVGSTSRFAGLDLSALRAAGALAGPLPGTRGTGTGGPAS